MFVIGIDAVIRVSPSTVFLRINGDLLTSELYLSLTFFSSENNNNGWLFKRLPVFLKNKLDGDRHVTV